MASLWYKQNFNFYIFQDPRLLLSFELSEIHILILCTYSIYDFKRIPFQHSFLRFFFEITHPESIF